MAREQTDPKNPSLEEILARANEKAANLPVQQVSFIPDMDDAQLRKLAREKLSMALQAISPANQPEMTRKLCAELMDRLDGKPAQALTVDQTLRNITVNATIRFAEVPVVIDNQIPKPVDKLQVIDNE